MDTNEFSACKVTYDNQMVESEAQTIEAIFRESKSIAVVGLSPEPYKASHYVPKYLQEVGYRIFPIYPRTENPILGEKVYKGLKEIAEPVDTVVIFRKSDACYPFIQEAIEIGAKNIWLQQDIFNAEGMALAQKHGKRFIQDTCMLVEHRRLRRLGIL